MDLSWPSVMESIDVVSSSISCWLWGDGRINESVEKSIMVVGRHQESSRAKGVWFYVSWSQQTPPVG
jgi:hypothetical protein